MAYLELGSPTLHQVDVLLQALLGMERGGSKARTPWLSQDPTSRLQALGEPKPAPPGPSPPQHRSPAVQRSSSASPCPAPSACERQPSGPLSHPCPGGAAVSDAPQHEVPTPPQPADGRPGWRKLLGEGEGPRLPSATRQVCGGAPTASGFGHRVAMALGCHGLSLCLPAAPALWTDPGGFPGSRSDSAGKGRDRAMRIGNGAHGGRGGDTPSLQGRVEPGPPGWRRCPVAPRGDTDARGHPGSLWWNSHSSKGEGAVDHFKTFQTPPSQHKAAPSPPARGRG